MNRISGSCDAATCPMEARLAPTIDERAIRQELDAAEQRLPGEYNALNFFRDSESGDWIASHRFRGWLWSVPELRFGKRNLNPQIVLAALREHIAGQVGERRAA